MKTKYQWIRARLFGQKGLPLLFYFAALLSFLVVLPAISSAAWTTEAVDAPKNFTNFFQRAIVLEKTTNRPHIAYGGDHLYHVYFDGTQWQYEIVDNSPGVGQYASISIDSNNKAYISYRDNINADLKYATNTSGSWVTSIIDSAGDVGQYASIALDSNNKVHISYNVNAALKYATNTSDSWVISTIDSTGSVGSYTSIAIDSNNKAHISYRDNTNTDLKYATNASDSWVMSTIDSAGDVGQYTSIALDSNNKAHISYYDFTNTNLKYATNASGSWISSTIDSTGTWGIYSSITIDSNRKVHISYSDGAYFDLKYITNASGTWVTSTIDSTGNVGWYTSIARDSNNKIHIGYYDATNGNLKYANNTSGSWSRANIDSGGDIGKYSSIIADSANNIHVSYYKNTGAYNGNLKYAKKSSGLWITSAIDTENNVGLYTSLTEDSNGKLHISYEYLPAGYLKYATDSSGSWATSIVDSAGSYSSIKADSNDKMHISYYNSYPNYDLKYATNASGSWVTYTIDPAGDVGQYSSIALDSNNNIHISYYDNINGDLKYATNSSGSWVISTIDSTGTVGQYTSIAADSFDKIHISYCDNTNTNLKYATNASGSWVTYTIDSAGYVGQYTSIALDSNNKAHISYYNSYPNYDLKYATNASDSWVMSTIDSAGDVGTYSSIALDSNNNVHISYYDQTNYDLKYATNAQAVIGPDINVAPVSVNFGTVNAGNALSKTLTVRNNGTADLIIGGIAQADQVAAPFSITTDNCSGQTLAPTASCTLIIRFTPALAGNFSDTFDIPSNDPDENLITVSLSGTGIISISGQVTNAGFGLSGVIMDLSGASNATAATDNNGNFSFNNVDNGNYTVTPGKAGYTFMPTSKDITVTDADVTGVDFAVVPPDIGVSPSQFNFSIPPGGSTGDTITITNSGTGNLIYSIITSWVTSSSSQSNNMNNMEVLGKVLSIDKSGNRTYWIPDGAEYSRKHILVKFGEGLTSSAGNIIHRKIGAALTKRYKKIRVDKVEVAEGRINAAINEYLKDERVEYAEPDYIVQASLIPNDPNFSQLWGLHNTGQDGGTADADIDAPEAWDINTGVSTVVAVIDTGVNYNHEDLSANMWVNTGEIPGNGTDDDGNGYVDDYRGWNFVWGINDPMDNNGHGTHCSGIIAGVGNNGVGVAGVNWDAKIMPLKFLDALGYGSVSDAVEAVLYAKNKGVRVSSNSWGGGGYSQTLYDAIKSFGDAGGLFVASAGNGGSDNLGDNNDTTPNYPSSYNLSNIIAVAATDGNDALASFSNYGVASVDLTAPGVNIYSTIISGYSSKSGTSMAAPHVSGVATLVLSRNPLISVPDVKSIIMSNVDPIPSLSGKMVTGGRLNAQKAVAAAGIPWLSLSSTSGIIAQGATENLTVTANAGALSAGTYNANIVISSNDPNENPVIVPVSLTVLADKDGDGYLSDVDCDDNDPLEHPGQTWFLDADGDGYSDGTINTSSCTRPSGFKAASELTDIFGDCDDTNALINPMTLWYPDSDGDGYGNPSVSLHQCTQPANYVLDNTDYDDNDPNIYPGGPPVRVIGVSTLYYSTLQEAYNAASDSDIIEVQEAVFIESLNMNRNISVTIEGGYDEAYSVINGVTTLNGNITISDGSATIRDVRIQ